jgi:hypothetical protein
MGFFDQEVRGGDVWSGFKTEHGIESNNVTDDIETAKTHIGTLANRTKNIPDVYIGQNSGSVVESSAGGSLLTWVIPLGIIYLLFRRS